MFPTWNRRTDRLSLSTKRARSRRLFLESLEARRPLAVYVVTAHYEPWPVDDVVGLSLPSAVTLANNNPGPDTIRIDAIADEHELIHYAKELRVTESLTIDGGHKRISNLPMIGDPDGGARVFNFGGPGENTYILNDLILSGSEGHATHSDSKGGAVQIVDRDKNDTLKINGSTITDSFAVYGGAGIYAKDSTVEIRGSSISNNRSPTNELTHGSGGGLLMEGGTLKILSSTVHNNRAAGGGGLHLQNVQATIVNSTFRSNDGAITAHDGHLSIIHSTIAYNGSGVVGSNIDYENSIFAGGINFWGDDTLISLGHNISDDDTGNLTAVGDMPHTNPLLDANLAPLPGSPAIDTGADLSGLGITTDKLGIARPYGLGYDIGAFEAQFNFDYGDAPDAADLPRYPTIWANGGARHAVGSLHLGAQVDSESDGQPTDGANGDDATGTNDDDGVFPIADMVAVANAATTASFEVVASGAGKLDAWIDFNQNDIFDHPDEHLGGGTSIDLIAGNQVIPLTVPAGAAAGPTLARFRISAGGGLSPGGTAGYGEVEDYLLTILDGDAPNGADPVVHVPRGVPGMVEVHGEPRIRVQLNGLELFGAPVSAVHRLNMLGTLQNDTFGIHELPSDFPSQITFDGREGKDSLSVTGLNQVLDLTTANTLQLAQMEGIDLTGSGANTLTVDVPSVIAVTDDSNTLAVKCGVDETLNMGGGWSVTGTQVSAGEFYRAVEQGDATLLLDGPASWQNPLDPLDINASNSKEPLDVLMIINELNETSYVDSTGRLTDPAQLTPFPDMYYDTNGDDFASPIDALLVINFLNEQPVDGEGRDREPAAVGMLSELVTDRANSRAASTGDRQPNVWSNTEHRQIVPNALRPTETVVSSSRQRRWAAAVDRLFAQDEE